MAGLLDDATLALNYSKGEVARLLVGCSILGKKYLLYVVD